MKTYRTAAQQDLRVRSGPFVSRLHCTGCGRRWRTRGSSDRAANKHAESCRRAPAREASIGALVDKALEGL